MDDPIGKPDQSGASHNHDFFGNTTTDAYSTLDSLRAGTTTCNRVADTAGYWMPSVYQDGKQVLPESATFYYRETGSNANAVVAFPPGFKMIAGDPEAMSPQPLQVVEWACRDEGAKKPWRPDIPQCPSGSSLAFRANFPDCWNGNDLDSPDHRSHVAYSDKSGRCPAGFPVRIPEIAMTTVYPGIHDGTITLSTHSVYGGHADFFNAWQPGALEGLVNACLRADRYCSDYGGPGGAEPLAPVPARAGTTSPGSSSITLTSRPSTDTSVFGQAGVISDDGQYVAYEQYSGDGTDVVVRNLGTGYSHVVSVGVGGVQANGSSYSPSVSAGGRYVAFVSDATNLIGHDTNGVRDLFVRDMETGTTQRVQAVGVQPDGASAAPKLSGDGRFVAFSSVADNLVPEDSNARSDIFRYEMGTGSIDLVSVAAGGGAAGQASSSPDISHDGRYVAFSSWARDLTTNDTNRWSDVFVRDMLAGRTELASLTDAGDSLKNSSYHPSVSDDGTLVSFESAARNVVVGDKGLRDVFVRNLSTGRTYRVSGAPFRRVEGISTGAELSGDGTRVVFESANWRLASAAAAATDVYTARPDGSDVRLVSLGGNQPSGFPSIDRTGQVAAFESASSTFDSRAAAGQLEVYVARLVGS